MYELCVKKTGDINDTDIDLYFDNLREVLEFVETLQDHSNEYLSFEIIWVQE